MKKMAFVCLSRRRRRWWQCMLSQHCLPSYHLDRTINSLIGLMFYFKATCSVIIFYSSLVDTCWSMGRVHTHKKKSTHQRELNRQLYWVSQLHKATKAAGVVGLKETVSRDFLSLVFSSNSFSWSSYWGRYPTTILLFIILGNRTGESCLMKNRGRKSVETASLTLLFTG